MSRVTVNLSNVKQFENTYFFKIFSDLSQIFQLFGHGTSWEILAYVLIWPIDTQFKRMLNYFSSNVTSFPLQGMTENMAGLSTLLWNTKLHQTEPNSQITVRAVNDAVPRKRYQLLSVDCKRSNKQEQWQNSAKTALHAKNDFSDLLEICMLVSDNIL